MYINFIDFCRIAQTFQLFWWIKRTVNCFSIRSSYLSICLSVYLSVCLLVSLSLYLSIYFSLFLSLFFYLFLSLFHALTTIKQSSFHTWPACPHLAWAQSCSVEASNPNSIVVKIGARQAVQRGYGGQTNTIRSVFISHVILYCVGVEN